MSDVLSLYGTTKTYSIAAFNCGHECCSPGHSYGPAVRPHYLIHYILKGKGTYLENSHTHQLEGGDGFLILPRKSTLYMADMDEPWEYVWFGFDGYEATSIISKCGFDDDHLTFSIHTPEFGELLLKLAEVFTLQTENIYSYRSYLYRCFSFLMQSQPRPQASAASYIEKALHYIHNNYSYDVKVQELADYLHIDRTYLYKIFQQYEHMSPQEYLIQFRLETACHMLAKTQMTVTEIACSCGFTDTPAFCRHFSRRYRMTASEYRKLKQV